MPFKKRMWTLLLAATLAGCGDYVTRSEFETYKQDIKQDGDAVDAWIAQAQQWFVWLTQNMAKICPDCDPPDVPNPVPDGEWGG